MKTLIDELDKNKPDDEPPLPADAERFLNNLAYHMDSAAALAVVAGIERKLFLKMAGMALDWANNFHDDMQNFEADT